MPPDPYERLQAARTAVKALKDERSLLSVRLVELARASDEEALVEASMRLDALPVELLRAELKLARADRQAAKATLQAAEASLARAMANVRDVNPLPDATVKEKLERAAEGDDETPDGEQAEQDEDAEPAPGDTPRPGRRGQGASRRRRAVGARVPAGRGTGRAAGPGAGGGRGRGGPPRARRAGPPGLRQAHQRGQGRHRAGPDGQLARPSST